MATISCRACISSLKRFEVAITNNHGTNPRLRMPRGVTRKAHSNQKTRGDVPALPIASRGSFGVGASEQQDSQCQTRSRFCLAPVKQVGFTHSKHTQGTHGRIGTHGALMGSIQTHRHTGTRAHGHTGTRHIVPCTREQISGCQRDSLYLIVSLARSTGQVSGREVGEAWVARVMELRKPAKGPMSNAV